MFIGFPKGKGLLLLSIFICGLFFLTLGVILVLSNPVQKKTTVEQPNVVLIVMDAFRSDRIGAERNGVKLTPFLDSLNEKALVFTNAVTPCTWTRPAMASIFTSLYMDTHQVYFGTISQNEQQAISDKLPESLPTWAAVMQDAGYKTIGIQANGNLSPEFGFDRGFDTYNTVHDLDGISVTNQALEQVQSQNQPFFLYAHYMDTHIPFAPPQQYEEMMGFSENALNKEERHTVRNFLDYLYDHLNYVGGREQVRKLPLLSEKGKNAVRLLYDGEVRYTDDEVKRLVKNIQQQFPKTIFIITADHGEHFWEHGYLGHGLTLYNCELRVPLYIFGSGIQPETIERPVCLIDLFPTVAQLLGFPDKNIWQGKDMMKFTHRKEPVFSHTRSASSIWKCDFEMLIHNGMKLIMNNNDGTVELYNWYSDPIEKNNVALEQPNTVAALTKLLNTHQLKNLEIRRTNRSQTQLDPETVQQLRDLGYMD